MIKVIYGPKGMGKTKIITDTANEAADRADGVVVFIDYSNKLIYDLRRKIRFVNTADFPPMGAEGFFGFICGILSQNYDIETMFVDGLNHITGKSAAELEYFFKCLKMIDERENITFYITLGGSVEELPLYLVQYT